MDYIPPGCPTQKLNMQFSHTFLHLMHDTISTPTPAISPMTEKMITMTSTAVVNGAG